MHKKNNIKNLTFQIVFSIIGFFYFNTLCLADKKSLADTRMSAEDAFMQGQKYLEQANTPLAELSLTKIAPSSPYAKLLAGNIAAKNGDIDRTFLLLLPLQSNLNFTNPAAASLHASLSSAYEKQGDSFNAFAQLINRESYLSDTQAIEDNHKNIWRLLSSLTAQDLISMRGEITDTASQGWIDLSLAEKNPDFANELNTWFNSYPDHAATAFAKTLMQANPNISPSKTHMTLPLNGNIALILPFDNSTYAKNSNAFRLGLQAALNKNAIPNTIKPYASLGDAESFADLYAFAKDGGASYFIGPMQSAELIEPASKDPSDLSMRIVSLLDANLPSDTSFLHEGFSLQDEAQAIATFAKDHAIQQVTILATDNEAAQQMVEAFQTVWQSLGYEAKVITLATSIKPGDVKSGDASLLDLKSTLSAQASDMLILAMTGEEAGIIRPYLDISIPTMAFSSVNDKAPNNNLNAIRFVDIPFLLNKNNQQFAYYQAQAKELQTNDELRWFALGVDTLQLLLANSHTESETIVNGLTGQLVIDKTGHISRQLPIGRFTYDSIVLEN